MSIEWSAFTWEAFATLTTGILAVGGATYVGIRQTRISKRQNEILDRQTRLAEAEHRADLFERRLQTFEATADFVIHINEFPDSDPKQKVRMNLFAAKLRESQFLFKPHVFQALHEIWERETSSALIERYLCPTARMASEANPILSGASLSNRIGCSTASIRSPMYSATI